MILFFQQTVPKLKTMPNLNITISTSLNFNDANVLIQKDVGALFNISMNFDFNLLNTTVKEFFAFSVLFNLQFVLNFGELINPSTHYWELAASETDWKIKLSLIQTDVGLVNVAVLQDIFMLLFSSFVPKNPQTLPFLPPGSDFEWTAASNSMVYDHFTALKADYQTTLNPAYTACGAEKCAVQNTCCQFGCAAAQHAACCGVTNYCLDGEYCCYNGGCCLPSRDNMEGVQESDLVRRNFSLD